MGTSATIQFGNIISEIPSDGNPDVVIPQIISALSKNNGLDFPENFKTVYPGNVYHPKTVPTYVDFVYNLSGKQDIIIFDYYDTIIFDGTLNNYMEHYSKT